MNLYITVGYSRDDDDTFISKFQEVRIVIPDGSNVAYLGLEIDSAPPEDDRPVCESGDDVCWFPNPQYCTDHGASLTPPTSGRTTIFRQVF